MSPRTWQIWCKWVVPHITNRHTLVGESVVVQILVMQILSQVTTKKRISRFIMYQIHTYHNLMIVIKKFANCLGIQICFGVVIKKQRERCKCINLPNAHSFTHAQSHIYVMKSRPSFGRQTLLYTKSFVLNVYYACWGFPCEGDEEAVCGQPHISITDTFSAFFSIVLYYCCCYFDYVSQIPSPSIQPIMWLIVPPCRHLYFLFVCLDLWTSVHIFCLSKCLSFCWLSLLPSFHPSTWVVDVPWTPNALNVRGESLSFSIRQQPPHPPIMPCLAVLWQVECRSPPAGLSYQHLSSAEDDCCWEYVSMCVFILPISI